MRYTERTRYFVAYHYDLEKVLEETATLDEAFHRAGVLSKTVPYWLTVWNRDENDCKLKHVRAFAHAGVGEWAQHCPKCKKAGKVDLECTTCLGRGVVRP